MKKHTHRFRIGLLMMILVVFPFSSQAATVSDTLEFKGRLLIAEDTPASNTSYTIRFSIWNDSDFVDGVDRDDSGNLSGQSWIEVQNFTTDSEGYFTARPGENTAFPSVIPSTHQYIMAEVKNISDSDSEYFMLDPFPANSNEDRKPLPTSVYAISAQNAEKLNGKTADNTANNIPVLDENGKLISSLIPEDAWYDPVADSSAMNAITTPTTGGRVFVISEGKVYTYDGSSWLADNATLESNITALQSTVRDNSTNISNNSTEISNNQIDIAGNKINISNNNSNINTNTTEITANKSDIADNKTNISTNSSDINTNSAGIALNTTNISDNQSDITENNTNITANTTNIGDLNYTAQNYITSGENITASIDSLDLQVKTNSDTIANINSNMIWKNTVSNFSDLTTTYPTATIGWTAYVENDSKIYTFNGDDWMITGGGTTPNATTSLAGIVTLAADGETTAEKVVQANDSRLTQIGINTANISTIDSAVVSNTNNISTNQTTLSINSTNISANATAINSNDNDIAANQTAIATNISNITNLDSAIIENTADITTNTSDINSNAGNITTNTSDIAANQTVIADNTTNTTNNTNSINTINSNIGNQTYTEQNFITNGETITLSIDALDQALKAAQNKSNSSRGFDIYVLP